MEILSDLLSSAVNEPPKTSLHLGVNDHRPGGNKRLTYLFRKDGKYTLRCVVGYNSKALPVSVSRQQQSYRVSTGAVVDGRGLGEVRLGGG